jgi:uncharacterized circularly permuted ATP-grasp superfamily protein
MNGEAPNWLSGYDAGGYYCEVFGRPDAPAPHTLPLRERLGRIPIDELRRRARNAENELYNLGVTFTVYSDKDVIDRILPFDVIPRVLSAEEWRHIEAGVVQRVTALNLFLHDVYHRQHVLKDGIVPKELVLGNANYRPEMVGFNVPCGTYIHICGVDIVRDDTGRFMVLEDNGRTPSGVSYVVENRRIMQRAFPDLIDVFIQPVEDYGLRLGQAMTEIAPSGIDTPQVVLLSPGVYNSAYFEHVFLAREMGVPLVEGRDLVVENERVFMKTTAGLAPLHVIYRRINDDFIDPLTFRPDSMLGVPGVMAAYLKGNVTLANAVGTGVSDDKAIYAYLPRLIRYYLKEDAILPNVETHLCGEKEGFRFTLDNLKDLVVKPVGESGGYGIVVGPRASAADLEDIRARVKADPANYISQPMVSLSVCPTLVEDGVRPRHVDLRPFAVTGRSTWVLPGGLSRVALRQGSLIVNSSQGGGSKDTWVLA